MHPVVRLGLCSFENRKPNNITVIYEDKNQSKGESDNSITQLRPGLLMAHSINKHHLFTSKLSFKLSYLSYIVSKTSKVS